MQDLIAAAAPHATKRTLKKRSILLYQGEAPRMAYIMKSGIVKVYSINNAGEEQVAAFHGPGDLFPSPWIFNKTRTTLYYYETVTDSEVYTLQREKIQEILAQPQFLTRALDYFVTNYTGLLMRITALEQSRAREKIMFTLYYLLFRYGHQTRNGQYVVELPLTHSAIASLVGLTRETTSGEINKLKREEIIQYKSHTYVVDKQKLERALGEDSFQDVTL